MNFERFYCSKASFKNVQSVVQRDVLVREYCDPHFFIVNYVDVFYRIMNGNPRLLIVIFAVVLSCVWMMNRVVAWKGLGQPILKFKKDRKLTSIALSTFVIPIVYQVCYLFNTDYSMGDSEDNFLFIAMMLGYALLQMTVCIGLVVLMTDYKFELPKAPIRTDLISIILAILIIGVFGTLRFINWVFPVLMTLIYLGNLFFKYRQNQAQIKSKEEAQKFAMQTEQEVLAVLKAERDLGFLNEEQAKRLQKLEPTKSLERKPTTKIQPTILQETKLWDQISNELIDPEANTLINLSYLPVNLFMMLVIPYPSNPLKKTFYRLILVAISAFWFFTVTFSEYLSITAAAIFSLAFVFFYAASEMIPGMEEASNLFMDAVCVFGSITVLRYWDMIVADIFEFLWFYFEIVRVVHYSILLVINLILVDVFVQIYIAVQGKKPKVSVLTSYATTTFSTTIYLAVFTTLTMIDGRDKFVLFSERVGTVLTYVIHPRSRKYFKFLFILLLLTVMVTLLMLEKNYYTFNKRMARVLFGIIGIFVGISVVYGFTI